MRQVHDQNRVHQTDFAGSALARMLLGSALVLPLLACEPDPPAEHATIEPTPQSAQPTASTTPSPARAAGRISLQASSIEPSALLRRLAHQEKFLLVGAPADDSPVSVRIEGAALETVLGQLLRGEAYALHYATDGPAGDHRLAKLVVGTPPTNLRPRSASTSGPDPGAALPVLPAPGLLGARGLTKDIPILADDGAGTEELAASDPLVRADGARMLDPDGAAQRLALLATSDRDPEVRTAAVEQLAGSEAPAASVALYAALKDSNSNVILAALDALAFRRDPASRPHIEALLDHPDLEVREEAGETLDFIE